MDIPGRRVDSDATRNEKNKEKKCRDPFTHIFQVARYKVHHFVLRFSRSGRGLLKRSSEG
jgi:hypothetical protein